MLIPQATPGDEIALMTLAALSSAAGAAAVANRLGGMGFSLANCDVVQSRLVAPGTSPRSVIVWT
jgi:hypothetical protein